MSLKVRYSNRLCRSGFRLVGALCQTVVEALALSAYVLAYPPGPRGGDSDSGGEGQVPLAQCNLLEHIFKTEDCEPNLNSEKHK